MNNPRSLSAATLGALGVVYGDIGTSPLYTLRECFTGRARRCRRRRGNVLGMLSLIFWALDHRRLAQVPRRSSCAPTTAARAACSR